MEILIFLGIIIYSIISSSKKNKEAESSVDAPTLDDIFKEVVKTANQKNVPAPHNGGFGAYIKSVDKNYPKNASGSQTSRKSKRQEVVLLDYKFENDNQSLILNLGDDVYTIQGSAGAAMFVETLVKSYFENFSELEEITFIHKGSYESILDHMNIGEPYKRQDFEM